MHRFDMERLDYDDYTMAECDDGEFVTYEEHLVALAAKDAEIKGLQQRLALIAWWCGADDTKVSEAIAANPMNPPHPDTARLDKLPAGGEQFLATTKLRAKLLEVSEEILQIVQDSHARELASERRVDNAEDNAAQLRDQLGAMEKALADLRQAGRPTAEHMSLVIDAHQEPKP